MLRILNTIKYLKFRQVYYRVYYRFRAKVRAIRKYKYKYFLESKKKRLYLKDSIYSYTSYTGCTFKFLNLKKNFNKKIDWNYDEYGKLWTYNLTYFEYLNQIRLSREEGLFLINDFLKNQSLIRDGFEAYPMSVRIINWIKFLIYKKVNNQKIDDSLYAHSYILMDNLEYHLLGNHLLENGFALVYSSYYFDDKILYNKGIGIIIRELKEQILDDGGHFELSPMYHQIVLFRLLDTINLLMHNKSKGNNFFQLLVKKSELMLGWLKNISYENGDIPYVNDSSPNIAPTTLSLLKYADELGIKSSFNKLDDSGYRKVVKNNYECFVDIGNITSSYLSGHTHADTFNFELRINKKPFIVDMGISTYEFNSRRIYERSTKGHNTVEVANKNSTEVWDSFRVGNRAKVIKYIDSSYCIKASHNGYKKEGVIHIRHWIFKNKQIIIEDSLNLKTSAVFRLYFFPYVTVAEIKKYINLTQLDFKILNYKYALGFNKLVDARYIEINFIQKLKIEILI